MFSSATDTSIQAPSHTHYYQEVRKIYSFIECPNPALNKIISEIGYQGGNNTNSDPNNTGPYVEVIENSTCQNQLDSTVFQDPCNPGGIFPTVDQLLGKGLPQKTDDDNHIFTNFYCKSGSPQDKNLMYSSLTPTFSSKQIDELADEEEEVEQASD